MPNSPDRSARPRGRTAGTLLRMREPIAWLVVAVTVVYVVLGAVRLGWNTAHESMSIWASARQTGAAVPLVWVLVDVAMVLVCIVVGRPVKRARALTRTAAAVVTVAAVYDVFILAVGVLGADAPVLSRVLETIGGLLEVAAKLAAAVILWRLLPAGAGRDAQSERPAAPARGAVWAPEQAAGRAWGAAGDVAAAAAGPDPGADRGPDVPPPAAGRGTGSTPPPAGEGRSVPWRTADELAAGWPPSDDGRTPGGQDRRETR